MITHSISLFSSHCPSEQCEGREGHQQKSCPCQLDPTHPPSGKRVPCVLCDIPTLFTSWTSDKCCQDCQHQWFKGGDWWPWPNNWIHFHCRCCHSRGQSTWHRYRSVNALLNCWYYAAAGCFDQEIFVNCLKVVCIVSRGKGYGWWNLIPVYVY